jgi:hypothetical protein
MKHLNSPLNTQALKKDENDDDEDHQYLSEISIQNQFNSSKKKLMEGNLKKKHIKIG